MGCLGLAHACELGGGVCLRVSDVGAYVWYVWDVGTYVWYVWDVGIM
jgi:hypothetical protein